MTSRRLVGVDVGGTFTDVMAIEDGRVIAAKIPTDVHHSETSVLAGRGRGRRRRSPSVFNLASTAGLNAVITRRIPKVAFLATKGHRDILDRGRLWRPFEALTDLSWRRGTGDVSRPLVPRYLRRGIRERLTSDGQVLVPLDEDQARDELELLARVRGRGRRDLPAALVPQPRSTSSDCASWCSDVLGDVAVLGLERGLAARPGVRPLDHDDGRPADEARVQRVHEPARERTRACSASAGSSTTPTARRC